MNKSPRITPWQQDVLKIFDRMRSRAHPYAIEWNESGLVVLPNVYSPRYFTDSFWFAEVLPDLVMRKSLLEIGTGTGIVALSCARKGARVVATDINPDAVRNARLNSKRAGITISVREGHLYEPIGTDERFDFIFWNHPFHNWSKPVEDTLLRAALDQNYSSLSGYIRGARRHLSNGGKLLLGTGDRADQRGIAAIARRNGYRLKLIKETSLPLQASGREMNKYFVYQYVSMIGVRH